jgi:two-component system LytT family sensor kinase
VLKRSNYANVIDALSGSLQSCTSESAVLTEIASCISAALGGAAVTWAQKNAPANGHRVPIVSAEPPHHVLAIGSLAGGRRLLSDDLMMLERAAMLAGRRIDALRLSDERYERMLREREIGSLATEAELRALRAQINPHFLFNALTTLGYLIQHAPARAFDTLMRLTTLLRSVLRSEGEFTTLGHERELIRCYLDIERERFEERLAAEIDIPETLEDIPIPTLIIQPLVENAIKHGIAQVRHGGRLRVSARVQSGDVSELRIVVRNTGAPLRVDAGKDGTGIGLHNVERRLRCYFGDQAGVTLERDHATGETVATLRLPTPESRPDDEPALVGSNNP